MKKFIVVALVIILSLSACSIFKENTETVENEENNTKQLEISDTPDQMLIVDSLGRKIQFEELPSKILIAGRQTPMLVNFMYLFETSPEKITAIERRGQSADDFLAKLDSEISNKYILERDAGVEQIAPLNPDVVILKTTMRESIGIGLEEVGIPVVYVEFESIEQTYRDLSILAALLGEQNRGVELINKYKQIKAEIDGLVSQATTSPNVLLGQTEERDGGIVFSVPPETWLQTAMLKKLGAKPLWLESNQGGGWTEVNIEQILNWDPDYFFVINYQGNGPSVVQSILNDPLWQSVNAIEMNQTYPFGYDFLSWDQPDPRWILGYSWLANKLYPELVTSEAVYEVVQTFYRDFYGFEEAQFAEMITPRIVDYFE